eukprot:GFYU01009546.1.p1 GENE.GFYU01009546.1~~GFYU01009546.1.p1  ORF type:complete len:127 (-),score=10.23 GFYU01009546.1:456-836(-)
MYVCGCPPASSVWSACSGVYGCAGHPVVHAAKQDATHSRLLSATGPRDVSDTSCSHSRRSPSLNSSTRPRPSPTSAHNNPYTNMVEHDPQVYTTRRDTGKGGSTHAATPFPDLPSKSLLEIKFFIT